MPPGHERRTRLLTPRRLSPANTAYVTVTPRQRLKPVHGDFHLRVINWWRLANNLGRG